MNLLIIGAPGAGKGSMSKHIVEDYEIAHISTGDILRQAIHDETPVGLKAKEYMDAGNLVPDSIIHDIIVERLKQDDIQKGFLFDGYPRTYAQAVDFTNILNELNKKIDAVIDLDISDDVLMKRITGRRLCPKCGEIYNIYTKTPKTEGICDVCNSELITRKDDNAESLTVRLEEYHKNTEPLIAYYEKMDVVKKINADQNDIDEYNDIKSILEGLK